MKKQIGAFAAATLALCMFPGVSHAAYPIPSYVDVVLNGKKVDFPDTQPFMDANSHTLVPVRFVSESMGATVKWQADTQSVDIQWNGKDIRLALGDNKAYVDNVAQSLDSEVMMKDGRTFVPLRFVSETMGANVEWDQSTDTVKITTADFTPDPNAKYDSYGRLIRTSNLPSNASDYPYVLADLPNGFYEKDYNNEYKYSDAVRQVPSVVFAKTPELNKKNVDLALGRIRGYFNTLLNVDYNNIDYSFADQLFKNENQSSDNRDTMRNYVDWVKQDHIQIEGYVDPEPSAIYTDGYGEWFVRCKYKLIINHFDNTNDDLIYDIHYVGLKKPLQTGVWYQGYIDVPINSIVYRGDWASELYVCDPFIF